MQHRCTRWLASPLPLLVLLWRLFSPSAALAAVVPIPIEAPTAIELEIAKQHHRNGMAWSEQGRYELARAELLEAYRISGASDLLLDLARTAEKMGQPEDAITYLEAYLQRRPDAADRDRIGDKIEVLRKKLKDEQEARERAEERKRQQAEVARLQKASHVPAPAALPEVHLRRRVCRRPPWPAIAFMTGGAALALTGIGLGIGAMAIADVVENPTNAMFDRPLDYRGKALATAGIPFDVAGVLLLGAGGAWTAYWAVHERKLPKARIALVPGILQLALQGSF